MRRHLHRTPGWIQKLYPQFVWQKDTQDKTVYLTFDDGPIPEVTEYVLGQLSDYQAQASFFVVGENLHRYPELGHRIVKEGHVLGNHTYNHLKGWQTTNWAYWRNVLKCEEVISKFQESRKLFRPPYGRIKRSQAAALKAYQVIMWNRLAWDFDQNLSIRSALHHLNADTPNGSIFVFHDNVKSSSNLRELLPEVLRYHREHGYTFSSLA